MARKRDLEARIETLERSAERFSRDFQKMKEASIAAPVDGTAQIGDSAALEAAGWEAAAWEAVEARFAELTQAMEALRIEARQAAALKTAALKTAGNGAAGGESVVEPSGEAALPESQLPQATDLPLALDNLPDGFFLLDRDYRFTFVNQRAAQNVGREPAQMLGKNIWETFPESTGTEQEKYYRQVMTTRQAARFKPQAL